MGVDGQDDSASDLSEYSDRQGDEEDYYSDGSEHNDEGSKKGSNYK